MNRDMSWQSLTMTCRGCPVQGLRCGDCVVTALVDPVAAGLTGDLPLDDDERAALGSLVRAGLVAPEVARSARAHREQLPVQRRTAAG